MSEGSAHSAIVLSAFVVAAIYGWRWLTGGKPNAKLSAKALYTQPLTSPEGFLVAWGVVYFMLAAVSSFVPGLAGALALLILFGDVLVNLTGAAEQSLAIQKAKTRKEAPNAKHH